MRSPKYILFFVNKIVQKKIHQQFLYEGKLYNNKKHHNKTERLHHKI